MHSQLYPRTTLAAPCSERAIYTAYTAEVNRLTDLPVLLLWSLDRVTQPIAAGNDGNTSTRV